MNKQVDIIGGGPSGMMAAITAARNGCQVRLWEKNGSLGRKLLATGNGRCNLSNRSIRLECYHGGDIKLMEEIFNIFSLADTLGFFEGVGLACYVDSKGRYFPRSNEASSVLFCLQQEMDRLGVKVNLRSEIVSLARTAQGWEVCQRGETHHSDAVILACGGAAGPQFGATGQGYELAARLSHSIVSPLPALVPIMIDGNWYHKLQGLRLDMKMTLSRKGNILKEILDEGLFTKYGISGPVALKSSRLLTDMEIECHLNFLPHMEEAEILPGLIDRRKTLAFRRVRDFLTGLLPEKLGQAMVMQSGIKNDAGCREISDIQLERLSKNLCRWPVSIKGLRPFKEAQVTAGGVDCRQIFSESLMSKKNPGLFFCGEIMDVDGDSGGYNLQWCWSSGQVAGKAAAKFANGSNIKI